MKMAALLSAATLALLLFAAFRPAPSHVIPAAASASDSGARASGNLVTARTGAPPAGSPPASRVVGPSSGPSSSVALRLPIPGRGGVTTLAVEAAGRLAAPTLRPSPFRRPARLIRPLVYGPTRSGIASTYGAGWSEHWVALPDGPGWRFRVCGAGGCRELVSTDAGPDLAMQRVGRIVDLPPGAFAAVCGVPVSAGLCPVSLTILGRT